MQTFFALRKILGTFEALLSCTWKTKQVLCLKVVKDFVDTLFSFLVFIVGTIIHILSQGKLYTSFMLAILWNCELVNVENRALPPTWPVMILMTWALKSFVDWLYCRLLGGFMSILLLGASKAFWTLLYTAYSQVLWCNNWMSSLNLGGKLAIKIVWNKDAIAR